MAGIYKAQYTRGGVKFESSKWYIKYRDSSGTVRRVPGSVDRAETEAIARRLEGHPATLADGLPQYIAYLRTRGTGKKQRGLIDTRIRAFNLHSLTGASVVERLPANAQTARHYLTALKGYIRWAVSEGILAASPIAHLSVSLRNYKPTFMRRALTCKEIGGILTPNERLFRKLSHADRRMIYLTALNTGFRAKEIGSLTADHLTTNGLMLLSGDSKNRKETHQPLPPEFHAQLSGYIEERTIKNQIWPGKWWHRANEMLQRDYICDVDFHCLRVTYITELVRKGYFPKQVQMLARHSTMELTMRYYAKLTPSDFNLTGLWQ